MLSYLTTVCGLDPRQCDYNRVTPLQLAVGHGHVEAVEWLLMNEVCSSDVLDLVSVCSAAHMTVCVCRGPM